MLRERFADLEDTSAPLTDGDFAEIDIKGYVARRVDRGPHRHRLPLRGRVGHRRPEARRGAARQASRRHPQVRRRRCPSASASAPATRSSFQVLVKETKKKVLPELTDEWVVGGERVRDRRRAARRHRASASTCTPRVQAQMAIREKVLRGRRRPRHDRRPRHARRPARWSAACTTSRTGSRSRGSRHDDPAVPRGDRPGPAGVRRRSVRDAATEAVRADLALRAVIAQEEIEATDDEVDAEVDRLAEQHRREAGQGPQGSRTAGRDRGGTLGHRTRQGARRSSIEHADGRRRRRQPGRPRPSRSPRTAEAERAEPAEPSAATSEAPAATRSTRRGASVVSEPIRNAFYVPNVTERPPRGPRPATTSSPGCSRTASSSSARPIDDVVANIVIAQLLHLESEDARQGHLDLHQLARRRDHRALRHLRHDAVHQARRVDHLPRPGRVGRRGDPRLGDARQALHPPALPRAHPPAARWCVGPGRRHRDPGQGDRAHARVARRDPRPPHRPGRREGRAATPTATSSWARPKPRSTGSSTR